MQIPIILNEIPGQAIGSIYVEDCALCFKFRRGCYPDREQLFAIFGGALLEISEAEADKFGNITYKTGRILGFQSEQSHGLKTGGG